MAEPRPPEPQPPGRVLELPSFNRRNNRPVLRGLAASVIVIGLGAALLTWLFGGYVNLRAKIFKDPKIFDIRVDGASIVKNAPPDVMNGVVEVPVGAIAPVTCETTVSLTEATFSATWGDAAGNNTVVPDRGCQFPVPAPANPGERRDVVLRMIDVATNAIIDEKTVVLRAVPARSAIVISHVPPDGREKDPPPAFDLRVSKQVRVLGKVFLPRFEEGEADLRVLVFVGPYGEPPVLQAALDPKALAQGRLEANLARLQRYRTFGPKGAGFYYMTPLPVAVGGPGDGAHVFRLVAAVVEAGAVDDLLHRHMEVGRLPGGEVRLDVHGWTLEDVRKVAWKGLVSEDMRVIRMSAETDPNGGSEAR